MSETITSARRVEVASPPVGADARVVVLERPRATITITPRGDRRVVEVVPKAGAFIARRRWETRYPVALIEHVLAVKGEKSFLDEIARDEDPAYVEHHIRWDVFSYDAPESFAGARILDFGSGAGASSVVLARLLPDSARIVGVELLEQHVALAERRVAHHGVADRVAFHRSPDGEHLPEGIGQFDAIVFSAVFEHLLPAERRTLLPRIWAHLKPGGTLYLDQTPYRWFPVETHTTGWPLLNYVPDPLAHRLVRLHPRSAPDESWESMLRRGVRGGTPSQVVRLLGPDAALRLPSRQGVRDPIDLWYRVSASARFPAMKAAMRAGMRLVRAATGVVMVPSMALAIGKRAR